MIRETQCNKKKDEEYIELEFQWPFRKVYLSNFDWSFSDFEGFLTFYARFDYIVDMESNLHDSIFLTHVDLTSYNKSNSI